MGFRMLSLCAAILAATLPNAAHANAHQEFIELRGRNSASVVVTFAQPVRIVCCEVIEDDDGQCCASRDFLVDTNGTYAGFAIERLDNRKLAVGGVRIPSMDLNGRFPMIATLAHGGVLEPGSYRILLLTDGRTTLRIRTRGFSSQLRLHPLGKALGEGEVFPLGLGTPTPIAHERRPVQIPPKAIAVLASQLEAEAGQINYLNHCLSNAEPCQLGDSQDQTLLEPCPGCGASGIAMSMVYQRGQLPAGDYEAVYTAGTAGITRIAQGFVLIFR